MRCVQLQYSSQGKLKKTLGDPWRGKIIRVGCVQTAAAMLVRALGGEGVARVQESVTTTQLLAFGPV